MSDEQTVVVVDPSSGAPENGGGSAPEGGASAPASAEPTSDRSTSLERRLEEMNRTLSAVMEDSRETKARNQERERNELKNRLDQAITDAERSVDLAKAKLTTAQEEGTAAEVAEAMAKLSEATALRTQRQQQVATAKEQLEKPKEEPAKQSASDSELKAWKSRNPWYGSDQVMTAAAQDIDGDLQRERSLVIGSPKYWEEIDRRMRQKFPQNFSSTPASVSPTGEARLQGEANNGQVRVSRSIYDGWERMGLNVKDPAVLKRLAVDNRQLAVDKGILPQTPTTARIRT